VKEYQSLSHTRWECKYHVVFIVRLLLAIAFDHTLATVLHPRNRLSTRHIRRRHTDIRMHHDGRKP